MAAVSGHSKWNVTVSVLGQSDALCISTLVVSGLGQGLGIGVGRVQPSVAYFRSGKGASLFT